MFFLFFSLTLCAPSPTVLLTILNTFLLSFFPKHLLLSPRTDHNNTHIKMLTDIQHNRLKMLSDSGMESSPEVNSSCGGIDEAPMSRTHQYRKVMKPLLERKRRARINKCLDDLKDIMVNTLQSEGESITKLEKADVLELTVKHLRKLKHQNALGLTPQATYAGRFRAGYSQCAQEVSRFMSSKSAKGIESTTSARLLGHLANCLHTLESMPPSVISMASAPLVSPPAHQMPSPSRTCQPYFMSPTVVADSKPLDLIMGKENQVQDLSLKAKKHPVVPRSRLSHQNSWRPW